MSFYFSRFRSNAFVFSQQLIANKNKAAAKRQCVVRIKHAGTKKATLLWEASLRLWT